MVAIASPDPKTRKPVGKRLGREAKACGTNFWGLVSSTTTSLSRHRSHQLRILGTELLNLPPQIGALKPHIYPNFGCFDESTRRDVVHSQELHAEVEHADHDYSNQHFFFEIITARS